MFRNLLVFVLASVGAGEVLVSEETGVLVVVTMLVGCRICHVGVSGSFD